MKTIFMVLFILLLTGDLRAERLLFPQYSDFTMSDYVSSDKELNQWKYLMAHGNSVKGNWVHWVLRVLRVDLDEAHPQVASYLYFKNFKSCGCCRKVVLTSPWLDNQKETKDVSLYGGDIIAVDGQFKGLNKNGEVLIEGQSWKVIDVYKGK